LKRKGEDIMKGESLRCNVEKVLDELK